MFINKLNQLYKPARLLYYVAASEEDIIAFSKGIIPDKINSYSG